MPPSIRHSLAWAGYKFTSTVLDDIWPQALFFTGVATMVCCVSRFTSVDLGVNSIMFAVLGTIVGLVVSFKTNNSYLRFWEGRNVWTSIASNSRQLAMLIWIQVPNRPKDESDDTAKNEDKDGEKDDKDDKSYSKSGKRLSASSAGTTNKHLRQWESKASPDKHDPDAEPLLKTSVEDDDTNEEQSRSVQEAAEKETKRKAEAVRERQEVEGMIEKKTYIGLIQAFSVAMKHSLRGEKGPFYSDLYSLIAFLPKYNPSAHPPVTRDHLLVLWHNGIPRQKWHSQDDVMAVPLTQPAAFDGYTFDPLDQGEKQSDKPKPGPVDRENNPDGLTTSSPEFTNQAVKAAARFVDSDDPQVVGFASVSRRNHRMCRDRTPPRENEKVTIAHVELMPPRHPPVPRYWDFFPPLRFVKIVIDWFKSQQRLEEQERTKGGKRKRGYNTVKSEIPQEMLMYLSAYIGDLADRGDLNASFVGPLITCIMELQKAVSDLEKLATTPIPSAYSFHLRLTVFAYLFFLPFQIYPNLGWLTIPALAIASIIYLGFLEIGAQIEMPFSYDASDLDLDKFCLRISQQLAEVTAFPANMLTKYVVQSHLNQPFLPTCTLSAPQLLGIREPAGIPTTRGFAAAFPEMEDKEKEAEKTAKLADVVMPKSVRDLEMTLNANWREIGDETKKVLGRQRDQLENKTGMEVAVLAL